MALTTYTWQELVDYVSAKCGVEISESPKDLKRLQAHANMAAKDAYFRHQYWTRFLIIGEPRTLSRGYVDYTEDSFHVYGAGTDDVNGLYQRNGTEASLPRYTKYGSNGTDELWDIVNDGAGNWGILVGADNSQLVEDTVYYLIISGDSTPPTSGWSKNAAAAENPAPLLVDVGEIDQFIRIFKNEPFRETGVTEFSFAVDSKGARVISANEDEDGVVWINYRKSLTDTYGDGSAGTTSDIPGEWFEYMARFAAREMQVAKAQNNTNPVYGLLSTQVVEDAILRELDKLDKQHVYNAIGKRMTTHLKSNTQL